MSARRVVHPKTFFLNERHELPHIEKSGGGGPPKLVPIDWETKGVTISRSLKDVRRRAHSSKDPLRERHYFLLAKPVQEVLKESKNKRARDGILPEKPNYAGTDRSQVFQRLGVDLLQVNDDGTAMVHALPERIEQLIRTAGSLGEVGRMEQARWVTIDAFDSIPARMRIDDEWLASLPKHSPVEVVIELQPMLTRLEIDEILRFLAGYLRENQGETLKGTGTDFSGRQWCRGLATMESLCAIAKDLVSVQYVHPPLRSVAASGRTRREGNATIPRGRPAVPYGTEVVRDLPTVAILDTGVPADHLLLGAPYRRGQYVAPDLPQRPLGHHGSFVASRIVFGDPDSYESTSGLRGDCGYYDGHVAETDTDIDDKSIYPAMAAVVATAPDVRVFNMSFDSRRPLAELCEVDRAVNLSHVRDIDNFIFVNDVLVVVAAGNTPPGVMPQMPYPDHLDDPQWGLGHWAQGYNMLTCGSTVERLSSNGLVRELGWPSAFSRLGPGLCNSPKPDFAAHGGNCTAGYGHAPDLGVWCCTAAGLWEDHSGTSYAAPLLAREAAFALRELQKVCQQGARPFAVTAKAFLTLTATRRNYPERIRELTSRAVGLGSASAARLASPLGRSAVLIWQGVLNGPTDKIPVQIPIPKDWLQAASKPCLRMIVAWDPPVNDAVHDVWACRKVKTVLRPNLDTDPKKYMRYKGSNHPSYPIQDKLYDLNRLPAGEVVKGDSWLLELQYEQIADYYPFMNFTLQQRVAFAAELYDEAEEPFSPQAPLQALPIAQTMTRLGVPPTVVRTPIVLRLGR